MKYLLYILALVFGANLMGCSQQHESKRSNTMVKNKKEKKGEKILFVLTSHSQLGGTGKTTGFYLSEASHPWDILNDAGYEIDFVSPKGGKAPVDGFDLSDPVNKKFWENETIREKIDHTLTPSQVDASDYIAIHYAGGHGTMWDFPQNEALAQIATTIYENGGIVSAVCHGPSALVNIKLSTGEYLVKGKTVSIFTNEEEYAVKLEKEVPFMLEDALKEKGAIVDKAGLWEEKISVDQRLITGQNPASAHAVGQAILKELQH